MGYWIDDIMKRYNEHSFNANDIPKLVAEIKCLESRYATLDENYEELVKQYLLVRTIPNEKECDRREKAEAEVSSLRSLVAMPKVLQLVAIKKKAAEYFDRTWYDYCFDETGEFEKQKIAGLELKQLIAEYDKGQDDTPKHELDWPNDSCCFYREK